MTVSALGMKPPDLLPPAYLRLAFGFQRAKQLRRAVACSQCARLANDCSKVAWCQCPEL